MPASSIDRIPDPLTDKFALNELPRIAPWVYEEITSVGSENIKSILADRGCDGDEPQPMTTWVSALSACHSNVWQASAN